MSSNTLVLSREKSIIRFDKSVIDELGGSFKLGPFTVAYSISVEPIDISGSISLFNVTLAHFDLNEKDPSFDVDIEYSGVGVKGNLSLDIPNRNLDGDLVLNYLVGTKEWKGTIYHW